MRMWMVEPKILCRKHLLGEHLECHMFLGAMQRSKNLDGFIKGNLFEVDSLFFRHLLLSQEMEDRKYNHKSPLNLGTYIRTKKLYSNRTIDIERSLVDLIGRCPECKKRLEEEYNASSLF